MSARILDAGKHVWSEKPLATSRQQAEALEACAAERGLRLGCAPDTISAVRCRWHSILSNRGASGTSARPLPSCSRLAPKVCTRIRRSTTPPGQGQFWTWARITSAPSCR
ncbi:hypothetical protein F6B42_01330 [Microbacterium radiodurans]|uniref:Gfo/Idh/MocA-like oxidoreductase N-terminal domain-containing protein n=1 Tax=Microbacterium radiodurans TaxID=661398 RepID=A0A5J5IX70_9MICO|nr:hypothetical protein F6B42_01330 [Microbacterium radiodurans]